MPERNARCKHGYLIEGDQLAAACAAGGPEEHVCEIRPERQCESTQEAIGTLIQCEREHGHGGAHTATVDDLERDPLYTYVVSWWPREVAGV